MASTIPNQRYSRTDGPFKSIGSSSSAHNSDSNNSKRKWSSWVPFFVALVVIAEIAFLGKLDMAKNADLVNSWADSFYQFTTSSWLRTSTYSGVGGGGDESGLGVLDSGPEREVDKLEDNCEKWLEKEDTVTYSRDFETEPIFVTGSEQEWKSCAVGCKFGFDSNKKPDAAFGLPQQSGVPSVLRSMESAQYYAENNIDMARRWVDLSVLITIGSAVYEVHLYWPLISKSNERLWLDLGGYQEGWDGGWREGLIYYFLQGLVGYFSWAEYDIMAPLKPKTDGAVAAAFISNCGARNFRLQALEGLERANIKIDSYGSCHRNHDGRVDKVETLKRYKFSLAFENSNEEDYVTEKYFQSLVAGSVPVVVGAPNIQDFAPSPGSLLHIKERKDVDSVAKKMKYLAENPGAYNESLRWKFEGPSDSFKALVDMAAVHSSCRLCIFLATKSREAEEKKTQFKKRPCKCNRGPETVYHLYVRERGRFDMESVFLRSGNLTLAAFESAVLSKFKSINHVPIWKNERPEKIRGGDELKVYRIYPVGMTQRQALYTFRFNGDTKFRNHIEKGGSILEEICDFTEPYSYAQLKSNPLYT